MSGQPTTLVLLPGIYGTGVLFRPLAEALPDHILPKVMAYPTDRELDYAELLPLVLAALPAEGQFVLLGESFGGPLALRAAATRPPGLRGVILAASFVTCPHGWVPQWAARMVHPLPFRLYPPCTRLRGLLGGYASPPLKALLAEALALLPAHLLAHRIRSVIRIDVREELRSCPVPLLYLRGTRDHVVPAANMKEVQRLRPDTRVESFSAPHMLLQTQAGAAADAISRFIAEHGT